MHHNKYCQQRNHHIYLSTVTGKKTTSNIIETIQTRRIRSSEVVFRVHFILVTNLAIIPIFNVTSVTPPVGLL